jgi:hypothetical protein
MVRQIGKGEESEYVGKAQAVLEHHFDCHEFCGDFCLRKEEVENAVETKETNKVYRCK